MLCVSFVEILPKGADALTEAYGGSFASWINAAPFFGGMFLIGIIDNLIPSAENPHETYTEAETAPLHDPSAPLPYFDAARTGREPAHDHLGGRSKLLRMGLFTALAITIHNFPEGLDSSTAAVRKTKLDSMDYECCIRTREAALAFDQTSVYDGAVLGQKR